MGCRQTKPGVIRLHHRFQPLRLKRGRPGVHGGLRERLIRSGVPTPSSGDMGIYNPSTHPGGSLHTLLPGEDRCPTAPPPLALSPPPPQAPPPLPALAQSSRVPGSRGSVSPRPPSDFVEARSQGPNRHPCDGEAHSGLERKGEGCARVCTGAGSVPTAPPTGSPPSTQTCTCTI